VRKRARELPVGKVISRGKTELSGMIDSNRDSQSWNRRTRKRMQELNNNTEMEKKRKEEVDLMLTGPSAYMLGYSIKESQ